MDGLKKGYHFKIGRTAVLRLVAAVTGATALIACSFFVFSCKPMPAARPVDVEPAAHTEKSTCIVPIGPEPEPADEAADAEGGIDLTEDGGWFAAIASICAALYAFVRNRRTALALAALVEGISAVIRAAESATTGGVSSEQVKRIVKGEQDKTGTRHTVERVLRRSRRNAQPVSSPRIRRGGRKH